MASKLNSGNYRLFRMRWFKITLIPWVPLTVIFGLILCAVFANYVAPHDPLKGSLYDQFIPPIWSEDGTSKHILGTDYFGRDNLSRLIYGSRISLSIAIVSIFFSSIVGISLGIISGYFGGIIDIILMRAVDGFLSFPLILMGILLAAIFDPSFNNVIVIMVLLSWPRYARQLRGETLSLMVTEYVTYARVAGTSVVKIMIKHIFPNLVPTILVLATFTIGEVIMIEALMSFLGVGVPPPAPSWGSMASEGRDYLHSFWWLTAFPGTAILLTILCINLFGDWLRDKLDPRLRQV